MKAPRNRTAAALLVAGSVVTSMLACNVFASLDQCDGDADCNGGRCDPAGKFCVAMDLPETAPPNEAGPPDVVPDGDAYVKRCYSEDDFATFEQVKGLEKSSIISARLVKDTTVLYSGLNGCLDQGCYDIFSANRANIEQPFGEPKLFPNINCSTGEEYWPTVTSDSLLLFFESSRANGPAATCGSDRARIWSSFRANAGAQAWSDPRLDSRFDLGPDVIDSAPYLHPDRKSLYFVSLGRKPDRGAGGGQDIWVSRTDEQGLVSDESPVDEINTPAEENFPVITADDKTLYFARSEAESGISHDVFAAHRSSPTDKLMNVTPVKGLDGQWNDIPAWISDDECRLYFTSDRPHADGGADDGGPLESFRLWIATRKPR